ncbi:hypothetical protein C8R46DRAFT_1244829 [Mycena filopes]|nr:hypothetical protein C8R46DRAFT_1244829 [Mycena filopes]
MIGKVPSGGASGVEAQGWLIHHRRARREHERVCNAGKGGGAPGQEERERWRVRWRPAAAQTSGMMCGGELGILDGGNGARRREGCGERRWQKVGRRADERGWLDIREQSWQLRLRNSAVESEISGLSHPRKVPDAATASSRVERSGLLEDVEVKVVVTGGRKGSHASALPYLAERGSVSTQRCQHTDGERMFARSGGGGQLESVVKGSFTECIGIVPPSQLHGWGVTLGRRPWLQTHSKILSRQQSLSISQLENLQREKVGDHGGRGSRRPAKPNHHYELLDSSWAWRRYSRWGFVHWEKTHGRHLLSTKSDDLERMALKTYVLALTFLRKATVDRKRSRPTQNTASSESNKTRAGATGPGCSFRAQFLKQEDQKCRKNGTADTRQGFNGRHANSAHPLRHDSAHPLRHAARRS